MAAWITKAWSQARRSIAEALVSPLVIRTGGGAGLPRETFPGAWQQNQEITPTTALASIAVYACVTQIAQDVGKTAWRLVKNTDGIWTETDNPAWSPVIRKPNRYQTQLQYKQSYIVSKLVHGNAYVLKGRDGRGVVDALYVLDPTRVAVKIGPDGAVYYQLDRPEAGHPAQLAGVDPDRDAPIVPASEIIHDPMLPLFHPLVGVSPLYACGAAALQGQTIQESSSRFFANGSNPGGILTTPTQLDDEQLGRLNTKWTDAHAGVNKGRIAILTGGMSYVPMAMSAVDAQLIDQLQMTEKQVCAAFHVPPYMVNIGDPPPYGSLEPLVQQYYASGLQALLTAFETCHDDGLELPAPYGTEFDLTDLILMDAATRTKAAHDAINAGALSPNEARRRYFGLGPVLGGNSPYLQQQYYSLADLADRPGPGADPTPTPAPVPAPEADGVAGLPRAALLTAARAQLATKGLLAPCHS
jgi:HK97 family phage portal protein